MIPPRRKPKAFDPDPDAPGQTCDAPGCDREGEYRAPKSRTNLREFHWFCLEHVREYNAAWDFYKGMSPGEIEREVRADTSWQRPTWPLGRLGASRMDETLEAELHAFTFGARSAPPKPSAPPELRDALHTLDLAWPVSMDDVKTRYKELAKRHHPDANGGDKASEEILKSVNLAYATLRGKLVPHLAPAAQPAAE
jgi:hypothetical protein